MIKILLLLFASMQLHAGALLTVYCEKEVLVNGVINIVKTQKSWTFIDLQNGRDFMRGECPECVVKISLEKKFIKGLD